MEASRVSNGDVRDRWFSGLTACAVVIHSYIVLLEHGRQGGHPNNTWQFLFAGTQHGEMRNARSSSRTPDMQATESRENVLIAACRFFALEK